MRAKKAIQVMVTVALVLLAATAFFAHQNGDDPANWINWGTFRDIALLSAIVIGVTSILIRIW